MQLSSHPLRGALFETWVVADYLKQGLNSARPSNLSFWRDRSGHEVDLLMEQGGKLTAIEIKSGATPGKDATRGLDQWRGVAESKAGPSILVYGGDEAQSRGDISIVPWRAL